MFSEASEKSRPMSDEKDKIDKIRVDTARGFAAFKVLLDERTARIDREQKKNDEQDALIGNLRERLAALEERVQNVKEDVTGKNDLPAVEVGKLKGKIEAEREAKNEKAEERKLQVEKWKASAPIYVALVTAFGALIAGIVNLILHFTGSGGGH